MLKPTVLAVVALCLSLWTAQPSVLQYESYEGFTYEFAVEHACPGAVSFCHRWAVEWAQEDNPNVTECIVEFMRALEADRR